MLTMQRLRMMRNSTSSRVNRRRFLSAVALAPVAVALRTAPSYADARYGPVTSEPYPVPAVPNGTVAPAYLRQSVAYRTKHPAGTIVIDPAERFLYLVQGGGRALRYGVAVGKAGFAWSGSARIGRKAQWPRWTPPAAMIDRQPELVRYSAAYGGFPPGPDNPLGARALYLYRGGRDTLYRIHGTNEPWSIGQNMSSGCIRLLNQDAIDLYNRVAVGAKVVVLGNAQPTPQRSVRRSPTRDAHHRGLY